MPRTIVTISDRNGQLVAWLDKSGPHLPASKDPLPLGLGAASLPLVDTDENLIKYGDQLVHGLQQHPAIAHVLKDIFSAGPTQSHTLCFGIQAPSGQQIRWESLRDEQGRFVALGGRCHIGRIAEEASSREAGVRSFAPPLRLLAFLSGAGLNAGQEWDALVGSVDKAVGRGLAVRARVHLGEPELLQRAQAECAAGQHPGVTALPMPADDTELEERIDDDRPHLLHFFCHGKAEFGAAYLELATLAEHATGAPHGSLNIAVDTLAELRSVRGAWLLVLNCCEGARAGDELDLMAYRMVSKGGIAAAIGMLAPVAVGEANRFCAALYPEVFRALDEVLALAPGAPPVTVDLSPAMSRPRRALRAMAVAANPAAGPGAQPPSARWTLPVLYLQDRPFEVFRPLPGGDDMTAVRMKADVTAGMLRSLPPNTPDAVRELMLATLDTYPVVPLAMRPDRWGVAGRAAAVIGTADGHAGTGNGHG